MESPSPSVDCDLNQNVLTHALCMRFTAASCLDGEEDAAKAVQFVFNLSKSNVYKRGGWVGGGGSPNKLSLSFEITDFVC